jgi:hypothetical protein
MADKSFEGAAISDVPSVYVNDVYVDIGASEISLTFREDFHARGEPTTKERVRVVMTHDVYMRMVDFLERRAKLFRRAYMNRTPNLYAGDSEELGKAFSELYPPSDETASDENPPEA